MDVVILTVHLAPSYATSGSLVQVMAVIHLLSNHRLMLGNESLEHLLHSQSHWVHICRQELA